MKNYIKSIVILILPALLTTTSCQANPQENLHDKLMKDWQSASSELKLSTCMDFIRIWKEKHGEQIDSKTQKEDAIKLVECLDQGVKEMPKSKIDKMTIADCAVSCCQYVIYGSIK